MRKQFIRVAVTAFLFSGVALAGLKTSSPVMINTSSRVATGNLGAVRNSLDNVQRIGCFTRGTRNNTIEGTCYATNAQGVNAGCVTTVPAQIETIRSISDSSYLYFSWTVEGLCQDIYVDHGSDYEPKK